MALRKRETWDALSDAYKARLLRKGITEQRYLSGEPLTAARGHATTPEHPERAARKPGRYPEYVRKHTGIAPPTFTDKQVTDHVVQLLLSRFGPDATDVQRVDYLTILENVHRMDTQTRIEVMSIDVEGYRERARVQIPKRYRKNPAGWKRPPKDWYWDGQSWVNPFWYH